jgi:dTDP-4-dehydrorhamnose 3,5-epimerase
LHYQIQHPQGKLVRVVSGEIFDVAVDLRISSPTFRRWYGAVLSDENNRVLWIPAGLAHGFQVLSSTAHVLYKTTDFYYPEFERTLAWNDPELNIAWQVTEQPIVSAKDALGVLLQQAEKFES